MKNNKITFKKSEMLDLWMAMHDLVQKYTKSYQTDFLIDILSIEDKKEIDSILIFLCRENGVELGNSSNERIKAYADYDETKYNKDYKWFIIDVKKYCRIEHMPHFTYLYDEEEEECCIKAISVNAVRNLIGG